MRTKLLLFLLVFFVPASVIIVLSGLEARERAIKTATNEATLLAESLAAQQEQIVSGTKQMLSTLAQLPDVQNLDSEACSRIFSDLNERYPFYSIITATTPDGLVFASSIPFSPGLDLIDRKHTREAIETGRFSAGEYNLGRSSMLPTLHYAMPVHDSHNHLIAIVMAGFKLTEYKRFMAKVNLPESCSLAITDHAGVRLYRLPYDGTASAGNPIPQDSIMKVSGPLEKGIYERTGEDGIERIYAFKQLRLRENSSPYLHMIVGIPKDKIIHSANLVMFRNLSLLGIAAVLTMGLAWVFGYLTFVKPISRLTAAARKFGSGDMDTRTCLPHTRDDLGQLAQSFDAMAELLQIRNMEQKKNEEDLADQIKFSQLLMDSVPVPVFYKDAEGAYQGCNASFERFLGKSREMIIGKTVYDASPKELADVYHAKDLELMRDRGVQIYETTVKDNLGELHHVIFHKASFESSDGTTRGLIGAVLDITERKRMEASLQESEQMLRMIAETIRDVFWVSTPDSSRIIYVSPAYESIWGKSCESLYQAPTSFMEVVHPDDKEMLLALHEDYHRGNWDCEYRIIQPNGTIRWIHARAFPVRNESDEITLMVGIASDITRRKQAEQGLRHSEERYRIIFDNATMGIFHSLPEGGYLRVNPALAKMMGFVSPEEMVSSITDISTQIYVDPKKRQETIAAAMKGGWNQSENPFRRKDGTILVASHNIRAVFKPDGDIDYLEGFVEDITARKEAEQEKETMIEVLHLINSAGSTKGLVELVSDFLRKRFQCDAVGIRIADGNDFPYIETRGFEQDFVLAEKSLCRRGEQGDSKPLLECLCGAVLRGDFNPSEPFVTERGSFWTGDLAALVAGARRDGGLRRIRGRCADEGYQSMALLPLGHGDKRLGLLQLNDRRPGFFSIKTVGLLERLGDNIVIGLARLRAEEALQEANNKLEQRVVNRTSELVSANVKLNIEIEERKRADEQLQKSKTMLQTIFDGISEPLLMLDGQMRVMMLNRAAKDHFQLKEYRTAIGKPCFEGLRGQAVPCSGCDRPFADLKEYAGSFERKCPLDHNRQERVAVYRTVREATGEQASIIRISDITHSKMMEKQLIQSEKLASLGLLISGIAHEINNPNSFISFNLPILRDYLDLLMPIIDDHVSEHSDFSPFGMSYEEFREDLFKLLDNMDHGSSRINSTVSGLKEFVRKREKTGVQSVDLNQIVDKAVMLCRSEINKRVKTFDVNLPDQLTPILSDPEALEQVLVNLLINASHAADKDDSWIKLKVVPYGERQHKCAVEVIDNGCGMDEATRLKVFDPFFTTKATRKGTGLGLYVSHSLIEGLGGNIEVESEPGRGSTFRVILNGGKRVWRRRSPGRHVKECRIMGVKVLVVDDERDFLESIRRGLCTAGYRDVCLKSDPREAAAIFERGETCDIALIDMTMPGLSGIELLQIIKTHSPSTECIMITAVNEASVAVECIKLGAYDYLVKPVSRDDLILKLRNAQEKKRLLDVLEIKDGDAFPELKNSKAFENIITRSPVMLRMLKLAELHAASDVPVLITGKSGTGKELLAKAVHMSSPRARFPLTPVNMASVSANFFDAEFFGHTKGAFTGAEKDRAGYLESTNHGTLFLDEIGVLPLDLQGKLLRVLQEGEFTKIGTGKLLKTDIRFVAATNEDLEKLVARGQFREDLYYRLKGAWLQVPPLKERPEDIPLLAAKFVQEFRGGTEAGSIEEDALSVLIKYDFPGNIRELKAILHAAVNLAGKRPITSRFLPDNLRKIQNQPARRFESKPGNGHRMADVEKIHILHIYQQTGMNKAETARLLDIGLNTLRRKLESYGER